MLNSSLKFAVKLLVEIEKKLYYLNKEGVLYHEEDSKILTTCYQTVQVTILFLLQSKNLTNFSMILVFFSWQCTRFNFKM